MKPGIDSAIIHGALLLLTFPPLAACRGPEGSEARIYRSLHIVRGHISPAEITAPMGVPITIEIDAAGFSSVIIDSPGLAIPVTVVPAMPSYAYAAHPHSPADIRKARFRLGPLEAGRYAIVCDCPNEPRIAILTVK